MKIYSVTEFRAEMNELLEQVTVVVQGEVSGFSISQNRFVWFSLKDNTTSVDCFMMAFQLRVPLEDGMEIRVVGSPTVFKKGKFTFRPRQIELVGEGSLKQAYDALKMQFEKEGLFDLSRKRMLPRFPLNVGLITSSDAAAYTDVLRILNNRWGGMEIRHMNVNVQGSQAVGSIVAALAQMNETQQDLDCIILTRGGGSLEDLHAFNDEAVVRAVFASQIPIVSGVGHERDLTLTDLVADVRASTPSNAAELVAPSKEDVIEQLQYMQERLDRGMQKVVQQFQERIHESVQVLDTQARSQFNRFDNLHQRLQLAFHAFESAVAMNQQRVYAMGQLLQSFHPNNILKRGYTLTFDEKGRVLKKAKGLKIGQKVTTRFVDGEVELTVN